MGHDFSTKVLNKSRTVVLCNYTTQVLAFRTMRYGERLKLARQHAGLSQAELAEKAGVGTQEGISKLERTAAAGSEFTVQYARACGISPSWLADEIGPMLPTNYQTDDPKLIALCRVMEGQAEYVKDAAVKEVTQILELVGRTKENSRTHG